MSLNMKSEQSRSIIEKYGFHFLCTYNDFVLIVPDIFSCYNAVFAHLSRERGSFHLNRRHFHQRCALSTERISRP